MIFFSESFPLHSEFSLVFLPENSLSKWTVFWGNVKGNSSRIRFFGRAAFSYRTGRS